MVQFAIKAKSRVILFTSIKMAVNESDSVETEFAQYDGTSPNQICTPIPRSLCIGHPYYCYCQAEKVGNGYR